MATTVTRARIGGRTRPQIERVKKNGFTRRRQRSFLATLTQTANVTASCKAAGVSDACVYRLRQKSAEFRAAWAAALDEGYERLELLLLQRAIGGAASGLQIEGVPTVTGKDLSSGDAMRLLKMHRDSVEGRRARTAVALIAHPDAVRERIEAKLIAMFERLRGASDGGTDTGEKDVADDVGGGD